MLDPHPTGWDCETEKMGWKMPKNRETTTWRQGGQKIFLFSQIVLLTELECALKPTRSTDMSNHNDIMKSVEIWPKISQGKFEPARGPRLCPLPRGGSHKRARPILVRIPCCPLRRIGSSHRPYYVRNYIPS